MNGVCHRGGSATIFRPQTEPTTGMEVTWFRASVDPSGRVTLAFEEPKKPRQRNARRSSFMFSTGRAVNVVILTGHGHAEMPRGLWAGCKEEGPRVFFEALDHYVAISGAEVLLDWRNVVNDPLVVPTSCALPVSEIPKLDARVSLKRKGAE